MLAQSVLFNPLLLCLHSHLGPKHDEKGVEGFEEAFNDLGRFVRKGLQPFTLLTVS